MVRITVHATPRSNRDEVAGWRGGELLVRVTAPPEGGKANGGVEKTIARALGVPRSAVRVVRGHSARVKQVEIDAEPAAVALALGEPEPGLF